MTILLQKKQQRAGRFGRGEDAPTHEVPTPDASDQPIGYVVDPEAVAAAIVERLVVGRTLPPSCR